MQLRTGKTTVKSNPGTRVPVLPDIQYVEANQEEPEEPEEVMLVKRLLEIRKQKLEKEILHLQELVSQVDKGVFDDYLITKYLAKSSPPNTKNPNGKKSATEKKVPTYEGRGKKAGTGEARRKEVARLNRGNTSNLTYSKKVGENTWSLMFEGRRDRGIPVIKNKEGIYDIPVFKQVAGIIGVPMKTKQDYIEWIKK